jgi:[ribosomal protein S5]-alanine N-acetyltransferase
MNNKRPVPFFVGEKVRLRTIQENDVKDLFRWFNDSESIGEFSVFRPIDWFTFEKRIKEKSGDILLIETLKGAKKIGTIHYDKDSDRHPYRIWIGYSVHELDERGKGHMTEAVSLLVDYLFSTKNVERIQATVDVSNAASQKVLERNAFRREGTLRKFYYVNGSFNDHYIYGLVRDDWIKRP